MALSTPSGLYYLFGVMMLLVALYCGTLFVVSVATKRPAGRDVEVSHVFMGIAMSGMFVGRWAFGSHAIWEIIFGLLAVWFVVEAIQSLRRYGFHLPHALIHAVMNVAMLLIYWFPAGSSSSPAMPAMPSMPGMSMSVSSAASKLDPGIAFVIAVIVFVSAIFTLASPRKGASHFGSHAPAYAIVGASSPEDLGGDTRTRTSAPVALEKVIALPWLVDLSHVAMCVAMGFMLLLVN